MIRCWRNTHQVRSRRIEMRLFPYRNADPSGLFFNSNVGVQKEEMSRRDNDDWDPRRFLLKDLVPAKIPQPPGRGRRVSPIQGKYLAGPIDVVWLSAARKLGVTTLWVGLYLWFLRGLKKSNTFLVTNLMLDEWGVLPDAKTRALRKLVNAGLITLESRGKRNPRVTLVVPYTAGSPTAER
jgi:hypothetical protein